MINTHLEAVKKAAFMSQAKGKSFSVTMHTETSQELDVIETDRAKRINCIILETCNSIREEFSIY